MVGEDDKWIINVSFSSLNDYDRIIEQPRLIYFQSY